MFLQVFKSHKPALTLILESDLHLSVYPTHYMRSCQRVLLLLQFLKVQLVKMKMKQVKSVLSITKLPSVTK